MPKIKIITKKGKKYVLIGKKKIKITGKVSDRKLLKIIKDYVKKNKKRAPRKKNSSKTSRKQYDNKPPEISGNKLNLAEQDIRQLQKKLEDEKEEAKKKLEQEKKEKETAQEKLEEQKDKKRRLKAKLLQGPQQVPMIAGPDFTHKILITNPDTNAIEEVELTNEQAKKLLPVAEKIKIEIK